MSYETKNYTEQGGNVTVIGGALRITAEGELSFDEKPLSPALFQSQSSAADVAALLVDFNALLTKLKNSGLMASE